MNKHLRNLLMATACASLVASAHAAQTLTNYQAVVKAQAPSYYFTFDGGSLANVLSGSPVLAPTASVGSQFIDDIFQDRNDCVYFTLAGDVAYGIGDNLISGGGTAAGTSTAVGTIVMLFRTPDPGPPSGATTGPGAKCIFSAGGATGSSNALYMQIENPNSANNANALTLAFGDSVTTILPATNVVWDTWYYFALTYNESVTNADGSANTNKATWYLGRLDGTGALLSGKTINVTNAVAGDGSDFFIGSQTTGSSTFNKPGDGRVDEVATWTNLQLSAAQIQAEFTNLPNAAIPQIAAYQTVISNQAPTHYFQLAGNTVDSMNPSSALGVNTTASKVTNPPFNSSVGYTYDYFLNPNGAAYFAFGSDAVYTNVNLLNGGGTPTGAPGTGQGSISGMFHALPCTNYYTGEKFIFDAGGSTATSNAFALFFEAPGNNDQWSLKMRLGDSSGVLLPATNVLSAWYYFAITYDETATNRQAHWWVGQPGGTLQSGFFSATNGSLAGEGDVFYIGNSTTGNNAFRYQNSSHTGNGQISQFTIWNRLLTTNDVAAQFSALSVSAGPPPVLSISVSGANAILSWPSSTDPGYNLQSTTNLGSPNWSGAGAPVVVGNNFVVTNSISGSTQFYRLTK